MRRRSLGIIILIFILLGALGIGYYMYRSRYFSEQQLSPEEQQALEEREWKEANQLLQEHKPHEAVKIIKRQKIALEKNNPKQKRWLLLAVDAAVQQNDIVDLALIYNFRPDLVENNEDAALLIGSYFVIRKDQNGFEDLRRRWRSKETQPARWFFLDVDSLQSRGEREKALAMLQSKTFEGHDEEERLIRLAQILLAEKPAQAWEILNEANAKDANNPVVHFYRARLLEANGKPALAMQEYIRSVQLDPDNSLWRDQLAEFFLRQRQYAQALEIWRESLNLAQADQIWIKLLFLEHVLMPVKLPDVNLDEVQGKDTVIANRSLIPLITYLKSLPQDQFWDFEAFEKVPNGYNYLQTQQVTFWLRLLQALKEKRENDAWMLVEFNPFSQQSWKPELERAIQRILTYRRKSTLSLEESQNPKQVISLSPNSELPPLFKELEELAKQEKEQGKAFKMPEVTEQMLRDPNIFAMALLNVDWMQAALLLQQEKKIPEAYPDWVAFAFTQAQRFIYGIEAAQNYAAEQAQTPLLQLLEAELWLAKKDPQKALELLVPLSKLQDDKGERAAALVAMIYIEQKKYSEAKGMIASQPKLAESVMGKEIQARIAFLEEKPAEAIAIYRSIEDSSPEAQSFLARQAFAEGDWARAKQLTEKLLQNYPNNPTVKQNYRAILQKEAELKKPAAQATQNNTSATEEPAANGARTP